MIRTLGDLRAFEDICLEPSAGPGRPRPNEVPQEGFGTFNYLDLAFNLGGDHLVNIIRTGFNAEFYDVDIERLLQNIERLKDDMLTLAQDINIIHKAGINVPVFPILYDKNKDTPIYITPEELTLVQFQQTPLYLQVDVLPYADGGKQGLNYPEFTSVKKMLGTELIPKSRIIIQNVLGNGECLFRSLINGYYYSERHVNLGFNPIGSNVLVNQMKQIFLQVIKYCLSDKKTQTIFQCSDKLYQKFIQLIQELIEEKLNVKNQIY